MDKRSVTLADGRELIYYGASAADAASYPDTRSLEPVVVSSQARYDALREEWVLIAGHRMDRTYMPPEAQCPLCPSAPGRDTEIPAHNYDVAVFQNRFPALAPGTNDAAPVGEGVLLGAWPGNGRCEVVCFSQDHDVSFADLTPGQAATVLAAWTDRTTELARLPGVRQVYCFENRGPEIGVTLSHPHGQIYAYPFVTPRTSRMLRAARGYRERTGKNLFEEMLTAERADGSRIVVTGAHWTAFVPHAAHWPYEVHLYPHRRVPDLTALSGSEQAEFCEFYLDLLRRFDRLFDSAAPYISGWHQAPAVAGREELALHLELFTIKRAPGKLKYLAGSESGMDAFTNDLAPEDAALRLRKLG